MTPSWRSSRSSARRCPCCARARSCTGMRGYNRRMKDISSEVMSFHEDSLRNLTSVKAFGIMDGFRDRMCAMQEKYRETYLDYNRFSVVAGFVMSVVGLLVSAGCFGWGAYRLWTHAISYGAMMMFLQLTTMLRSAFSALIGLCRRRSRSRRPPAASWPSRTCRKSPARARPHRSRHRARWSCAM